MRERESERKLERECEQQLHHVSEERVNGKDIEQQDTLGWQVVRRKKEVRNQRRTDV